MMLRSFLLLAFLAVVAFAHPARADDPAPADILKDKGLVKQGGLYIASGEEEVIKGMRLLRVSRRKLDEELKTRAQMEQRIKFAENSIAQWKVEYTALSDKISNTKDAATQNQIIGRLNATAGRINQGTEEKKRMEEQASKVGKQSKIQFADAVMALAPKVDAVSRKYKDLAADEAVASALEKLNQTARPKMKLGPSTEFASAANLLKKWRLEVEDETIPVKTDSNTPTVEVTLNGSVTRQMILDTGASDISLPADLAAELKMVPGPNDPAVKMKIADGSTVEAHLMRIKSVRVGRFEVQDVECVVMPRSMRDAPALLGDSFLSHFVWKLDANAGELHLMELAGATRVTDSPGEKNPKAPAKTGAAPVKSSK